MVLSLYKISLFKGPMLLLLPLPLVVLVVFVVFVVVVLLLLVLHKVWISHGAVKLGLQRLSRHGLPRRHTNRDACLLTSARYSRHWPRRRRRRVCTIVPVPVLRQ